MELNSALKNNHFCSSYFARLADILESNPKLQQKQFNYHSNTIQPFMQTHVEDHVVSPWPCIIDSRLIDEMNNVVRKISPLIYKSLKIFHKKNEDEFCKYLNVTPVISGLFENYRFEPKDLPIRFDAVIEEGIIKLLEINCGSSLGGWQMEWLQKEVMSSLLENEESAKWNLKHHSVCSSMFKAISQAICRQKGERAKGNLLYFIPNNYGGVVENAKESLIAIYDEIRPSQYPEGKIFFISDLKELELTADGYALCQGEVMDALLLAPEKGSEFSESFHGRVHSASLSGNFYYGDDTNYALMGNKLIFSLLHEEFIRENLTEEEKDVIDRYVPWTKKLSKESFIKNGKTYQTRDYLIQHKDKIVLKKSHSMQGKDVYVGYSFSQKDWLDIVESYVADNDWIAQQYCEPDIVVSADSANGLGTYRMVWGFFSLGGKYGGCFLRGVPTQSDSAVINSANGAIEFLVFEEQPLKNKISL